MNDKIYLTPVAYIKTPFKEKFGIPRQSGRVPDAEGIVVFEKEFSSPEAVRALEGFSHIWLIFGFSEFFGKEWTPTIRPPRLGGNERVGVFASRSPHRPNPIGMSCVRLEKTETKNGRVILMVSGVDLLDATPIYDIKPYLPHADSVPDASAGYSEAGKRHRLEVRDEGGVLDGIPEKEREVILSCIADDPRPSYQDDPNRVYSMKIFDLDVSFAVSGSTAVITGKKDAAG